MVFQGCFDTIHNFLFTCLFHSQYFVLDQYIVYGTSVGAIWNKSSTKFRINWKGRLTHVLTYVLGLNSSVIFKIVRLRKIATFSKGSPLGFFRHYKVESFSKKDSLTLQSCFALFEPYRRRLLLPIPACLNGQLNIFNILFKGRFQMSEVWRHESKVSSSNQTFFCYEQRFRIQQYGFREISKVKNKRFHWFCNYYLISKETSRERHKSAPYLRLKNSKRTSKSQTFVYST